MEKRRYAWQPDLPDRRDYRFTPQLHPAPSVPKPAWLPPVRDQGQLGSCTAHAGTACIEAEEIKRIGSAVTLSPLFFYYQERRAEGTVRQDAGASIRDGLKAAAKVGCCSEVAWPYDIAQFKRKPSTGAYADAATRRINSYMRLGSVFDIQCCLTEGFPVAFGFSVYESFESDDVARTGVVPMPGPLEKMLGGHEVMAVGYDSSDVRTGRALCMNSWGPGWGQAGFFTMPWAYLADRDLADDFWTVRR